MTSSINIQTGGIVQYFLEVRSKQWRYCFECSKVLAVEITALYRARVPSYLPDTQAPV